MAKVTNQTKTWTVDDYLADAREERSYAMSWIKDGLQGQRCKLEETRRLAWVDSGVLATMCRTTIWIRELERIVGAVDGDGKDVLEVLKAKAAQWTESLLKNWIRPSSTCPWSRAEEIERAEQTARMLETMGGLIHDIERADKRYEEAVGKDAAKQTK